MKLLNQHLNKAVKDKRYHVDNTILATIVYVGSINQPSDKDKELGNKVKILVKRDVEVRVDDKQFTESLLYSVKLKEIGPIKVGDRVVIEGRAYEFEGRRGFSNAKVTRLA